MSECCLFYSLWVLRVRGQAGAPSLSIDIIHKKKKRNLSPRVILCCFHLEYGFMLTPISRIDGVLDHHVSKAILPRWSLKSSNPTDPIPTPIGFGKKNLGRKRSNFKSPEDEKWKVRWLSSKSAENSSPLHSSVISTTINGALKLASRAAALPYKNAPFATISSIRSLSFIKSRLCLPPNSSPILFSKEDDFCPETHKPFWVYFSESFSL